MTLPLVTVGVVTNRPWTSEWLTWNLSRIAYRPIELIVATPWNYSDPWEATWIEKLDSALRIYANPPGAVGSSSERRVSVGALRNLVIEHAKGELLTWIDDDDWHHPMRIHALVEAHALEPAWQVGFARSYFLHLATSNALRSDAKRPINGSSIFVTDALRSASYDDEHANSDARYLAKLRALLGEPVAITKPLLAVDVHAIYLRHGANTCEGLPYGSPMTLESIARRAGIYWPGTEAELERLVARHAGATETYRERKASRAEIATVPVVEYSGIRYDPSTTDPRDASERDVIVEPSRVDGADPFGYRRERDEALTELKLRKR